MAGAISIRHLLFFLILGGCGLQIAQANNSNEVFRQRVQLAQWLLRDAHTETLKYHVSGVRDQASAYHNLLHASQGQRAKRSYYGRAPGGSTVLDVRMLRALYTLRREGYSFRITELAGGSHARNSRHYAGTAFDIDKLNGRKISSSHPLYRRFIQRCKELGATQVYGPGSPGHRSHLHVAWNTPEQDAKRPGGGLR